MLNKSENAVSLHRSLSWSDALRVMRADRQPVIDRSGINAAKIEAMRAATGARAGLWTTAGGFDRRAIMLHAIANARCVLNGAIARGCWRTAMANGLKGAWEAAHAARRAAAH